MTRAEEWKGRHGRFTNELTKCVMGWDMKMIHFTGASEIGNRNDEKFNRSWKLDPQELPICTVLPWMWVKSVHKHMDSFSVPNHISSLSLSLRVKTLPPLFCFWSLAVADRVMISERQTATKGRENEEERQCEGQNIGKKINKLLYDSPLSSSTMCCPFSAWVKRCFVKYILLSSSSNQGMRILDVWV